MTAAYLSEELRKADYERYLLGMFAPRRVRPYLWALFLLNHEIARTRYVVSETALGHIRLQWWRDEIAKLYAGGGGGQTPMLSTLAPLIHSGQMPIELFDELIYAREFDLEGVSLENLQGLRAYARLTTSPLNRLGLKILHISAADAEIDDISENFGVIQMLRRVPFSLSYGHDLLPANMKSQFLQTGKKEIDIKDKESVSAIVNRIVNAVSPMTTSIIPFLSLQSKMTSIYLRQLQKSGGNVFSDIIQRPAPFLALRLAINL